jgi:hypothetical protein
MQLLESDDFQWLGTRPQQPNRIVFVRYTWLLSAFKRI